MLRLRRLAGARTLAVCREVVTTQTGLSMTMLLGGCAQVSGRLKGAPGGVGTYKKSTEEGSRYDLGTLSFAFV